MKRSYPASLLKTKTLRVFGLVAVIVVVAFSVLAVSVEAGPLTRTKRVTLSEQKDALAYWTRERVANAPAMALMVDMGEGGVDAAALEEEDFIGPAEFSPPEMADPDADQIAQEAFAEDWEALEGQEVVTGDGYSYEDMLAFEEQQADLEEGTKNVYTYFDVNTVSAFWKIYPHRWDGKLTFTTPSGNSSCSATVIKNNHIVTAAHCVYDTASRNRWYTNWVFTPAYRNGNAPYGTWTAASATILTAWVNLRGNYSINGWAKYDIAVIKLNTRSGRTINSYVGNAGYLYNASDTQLVFNSGYPGEYYTGSRISTGAAQYLRACIAETGKQTTDTLYSGCYWGRGISGGSWLVAYKPFKVSGMVNSVNSGLYIGQPNLYGAKFTSNNFRVICNASGCL
jgi:hypothetical protein